MKRLFVAIATLSLAAAVASAQDFNAAVDTFNAGAQAMETNKTEALAKFRSALEMAQACTEEDTAEFISNCKTAITGALLSIAKEQINEAAYDEALATLAEAKTVAAEYEEAEAAAEVATLIPNVYMRKGSTLLKNKEFAAAVATFKELVEITPEDGQANLLLGQALMQSGNMDGAIESLTKANELGEANAAKLLSIAYLREGQSLLKAGKNLDAVAALEKSNSYSESANAYKLIASAYTKAGKSKDSINAYKKYLEVSPNAKDAADIIFTIAATAQKAGD